MFYDSGTIVGHQIIILYIINEHLLALYQSLKSYLPSLWTTQILAAVGGFIVL